MSAEFDLLVIGAGVNGCAIARDAAGRGLSVALVDRGDLAGETSSATSKLIHGGLRYLEHGEFRMVRESLRERARLLKAAPHLVEPLRFVMPHDSDLRPRWMLRLGLWLYDRMGGAGAMPHARTLDLRRDPAGANLRSVWNRGFEFHDARTDDARLVLALARDAAARGAQVWTRMEVRAARPLAGVWEVELQAQRPEGGGAAEKSFTIRAQAVVNAAGPWALSVAARLAAAPPRGGLRLVQGTHLVVPRPYPERHAYLFQNADRRVVFFLPWGRSLALLGTTDVLLQGPPESARPHEVETDYLCNAAARWMGEHAPRREDVMATFTGVRPLFDDGRGNPSRVSRDRRLLLDRTQPNAPLLHVLGGKLTTHRALAEEAVDSLAANFPACGPAWTADALLPGAGRTIPELSRLLQTQVSGLSAATAEDLAARHGEEAFAVLRGVLQVSDLGEELLPGFYARELAWFVREEWARTADDVLLRRTRLGWGLAAADRARISSALTALQSAVPDRR